MTRGDGRLYDELRPTTIITDTLMFAEGSATIETGHTKVLCAVSVEDGVQTYRVQSMGARSNVDSQSGYSSKYNDDEWVHYQNYIPGNFRDQELLTIWVDDRTHYRIARTRSTGEARYVLMRRMEEDLQTYSATLLTVDGEITLIRVFERCEEPCEPPEEYLPRQ